MKNFYAALFLIATFSCKADAEIDRHAYEIEWSVQAVPASEDIISVKKDSVILTTRLLPKRLFKSTYPIFSERGENLVDAGELFVMAKSDLFVACTPMILNKTRATNRAGSLQVCVVDLDNDGMFDHYFTKIVGQIQGVLIQGSRNQLKIPDDPRPLSKENKFIEVPVNTDATLPSYNIKYGGGTNFFSCLGSGMAGQKFGCFDRDFYWIKKYKNFVISGA